ncbi:hypothetical protein NUW58_g5671 [Xylaria curta]|uniref:Uncharacterized protein n=1 Tax=Xylaria curta TaxID=42375 RepID=A0ACC1P3I4_9PEZI|nr:hypothetical protein NUW58_g5671 [Xylaria curta]
MGIELILAEIFILYAFAVIFIGARIFARYMLVGLKGFQPDDFLVLLLLAVWTGSAVIGYTFTIVAQGKHTSLLTPEQREDIPVADREGWSYGSKIFLAGLTGYILIVWIVKLNQLFFYRRVVRGLWVQKTIFPAMGFLAAAFVAIILTITLNCLPFEKVWQVYPDPGANCVPQSHAVFTVILSLNLATDFCILLIPLPALRSLQLPLTKKLGLWLLFSLGALCMVFAILRYVYVFQLGDSQGISASWSTREAFVATFVGQAPMIYPLCTPRFWARRRNKTVSSSSHGLSGNSGNRHKPLSGEEHEMGGSFAVSSGGGRKEDGAFAGVNWLGVVVHGMGLLTSDGPTLGILGVNIRAPIGYFVILQAT